LCVVHAAAAAAAAMKGNFLQLSAKLYAIIYIYWARARTVFGHIKMVEAKQNRKKRSIQK